MIYTKLQDGVYTVTGELALEWTAQEKRADDVGERGACRPVKEWPSQKMGYSPHFLRDRGGEKGGFAVGDV